MTSTNHSGASAPKPGPAFFLSGVATTQRVGAPGSPLSSGVTMERGFVSSPHLTSSLSDRTSRLTPPTIPLLIATSDGAPLDSAPGAQMWFLEWPILGILVLISCTGLQVPTPSSRQLRPPSPARPQPGFVATPKDSRTTLTLPSDGQGARGALSDWCRTNNLTRVIQSVKGIIYSINKKKGQIQVTWYTNSKSVIVLKTTRCKR
ncbi:hypothetical protein DFH28DRAFT_1105946 [Melampsora americana]|nr:hypothetical protein DFH28DRAFT_1105946 [Melampsora americana]